MCQADEPASISSTGKTESEDSAATVGEGSSTDQAFVVQESVVYSDTQVAATALAIFDRSEHYSAGYSARSNRALRVS